MAADDIANIISRLDRQPFISQEVVFGEGEPIQPNQYVGNGDVQEYVYHIVPFLPQCMYSCETNLGSATLQLSRMRS